MSWNADDSDHPTRTKAPASGIAAESTLARRPDVPSLALGATFGPYRILRLLGTGGMGEAYEAEQIETGRRVALKVLADPDPSPQARERFLREGRLAASLNHPNCVYVFGTEEIEDRWAIAMELAGGGTLKDRVRERGPLSPREVADTMLQVIDGLAAAATAGILHRDIKPANCFLELDGTAKIGDFGLSLSTLAKERSKHQLTGSGTFLGTPAFASPEQLRGEDLDLRSDIYSLGATMYYLLAARPPFENANLMELLTTIATSVPAAPHKLRPGVPDGLSRLVMRCLEKEPDRRPGDYLTLRDKLRDFATPREVISQVGLGMLANALDMLVLGIWSWLGVAALTLLDRAPSMRTVWLCGTVGLIFLPVLMNGRSLGDAMLGLRLVHRSGEHPSKRSVLLAALAAMLGATWAGERFAATESAPRAILYYVVLRSILTERGLRLVWARTLRERRIGTEPRILRSVAEPAGGVGPYRVESRHNEANFQNGHDPVLDRNVWIHLSRHGLAASPARRDLHRPARLRWINGGRTAEVAWDAYEAPDGMPLSIRSRPMDWSVARVVALRLAREILSGRADGTLPSTLSLSRVWVDEGGGVKLLDHAPPETGVEQTTYRSDKDSEVLAFLGRVIERLVSGPFGSMVLPRNARCLLTEMERGSVASLALAGSMLSILAHGEVARTSRAPLSGYLAGLWLALFPVFLIATMKNMPEALGVLVAVLGYVVVLALSGGVNSPVLEDRLWPPRILAFGRLHEIVGTDGLPVRRLHAFLRDLVVVAPVSILCLLSYWLDKPLLMAPLALAGLALVGFAWRGRDILGALTGTRLVPTHLPFGDGGTDRASTYETLRELLDQPEFKDFDTQGEDRWQRLEEAARRGSS